jgi:hypothetical protein
MLLVIVISTRKVSVVSVGLLVLQNDL